ncbi:hypothetical protein NDU88_000890 [Pleurodeles waltl]|uniref:Uncharacterized protein n=1 Tax=Pleurodeles waltl TaxID=8319 RepID=A0AAV7LZE7_PLEWA|nr:hypothetical protein NDU88_000890 [Pleurodeles waltl]
MDNARPALPLRDLATPLPSEPHHLNPQSGPARQSPVVGVLPSLTARLFLRSGARRLPLGPHLLSPGRRHLAFCSAFSSQAAEKCDSSQDLSRLSHLGCLKFRHAFPPD